MFESVGRDRDREAGKRRLESLGLTVALLAGVGGFTVGVAAWTASEVITELLEDDEMVELVMEDPVADEQGLSAPPPPPPPAAAAPEEPETTEEQADPDVMDEDVADLDEEPPDEVRSAARPEGVEGGKKGGEEGGVPDGVVGFDGDGPGGPGIGGAPRVLHHSELQVKRKVGWDYPKAALELDLGSQRCLARVFIDERGVPYDVRVEACPRVFHDTTVEALMKWRWYPPKEGGSRFRAQTTIGVTYDPR